MAGPFMAEISKKDDCVRGLSQTIHSQVFWGFFDHLTSDDIVEGIYLLGKFDSL